MRNTIKKYVLMPVFVAIYAVATYHFLNSTITWQIQQPYSDVYSYDAFWYQVFFAAMSPFLGYLLFNIASHKKSVVLFIIASSIYSLFQFELVIYFLVILLVQNLVFSGDLLSVGFLKQSDQAFDGKGNEMLATDFPGPHNNYANPYHYWIPGHRYSMGHLNRVDYNEEDHHKIPFNI